MADSGKEAWLRRVSERFWDEHRDQALELARRFIESSMRAYVDEIVIDEDGVLVRVFWASQQPPQKYEADLRMVVERLRGVFGMPVNLWLSGPLCRFTDSGFQQGEVE